VVDVTCGGHPISRRRLADAIVTSLWRPLLEPRGPLRRALEARCGIVSSRDAAGQTNVLEP
jgi:hypothetical protein